MKGLIKENRDRNDVLLHKRSGSFSAVKLLDSTTYHRAVPPILLISIACSIFYNPIGGLLPGNFHFWAYNVDFDVYRIGGQVWLSGEPLYGQIPTTRGGAALPFTYPPLAAVLFSTFRFLPLELGSLLFNIGSIACLWVVLFIVLRRVTKLSTTQIQWLIAGIVTVAVWFGPMRSTLVYGQINTYLMMLVVVDAFVVPRRFRGVLTGFAISLKLTPAVFVLYFLAKKEYRTVIIMGISTIAWTGLGWLLAPRDSLRYFGDVVFEAKRIGSPWAGVNQSMMGFLSRITSERLSQKAQTLLWVFCVVILLSLMFLLIRRLITHDQSILALISTAIFGLLASPISWTHHWVWMIPLFVVLSVIAIEFHYRKLGIFVGIGLVLFAVNWSILLPHDHDLEKHWSVLQTVIGNTFLEWTILALIVLWFLSPRLASDRESNSHANHESFTDESDENVVRNSEKQQA